MTRSGLVALPGSGERTPIDLRILNDLARIDRHRTMHLVGACVAEGGLAVKAPPGSEIIQSRRVERRPDRRDLDST